MKQKRAITHIREDLLTILNVEPTKENVVIVDQYLNMAYTVCDNNWLKKFTRSSKALEGFKQHHEHCKRPLVEIDENGKILQWFDSQTEAAKYYQVTIQYINKLYDCKRISPRIKIKPI